MIVLRNLTLILENTPVIRRFAGAIFLYGQKPPRSLPRPAVRMTEHAALHGAVSVVVPCYNEEMNVGPLVEGLLQHYDEYIDEIVLVDDNSKDRTREVMRELAAHEPRVRPVFRTPPNGVGRALRDGLAATTGRYVLLMDCDFLHILPELRDMFDAAARGSAVVLGSRFSRYSVLINYPLQKILCNRCFHILLSILFRRRLRDVTNNLKLLRRDVVDNLEIESAWFAANAETGLKPLLMGYPDPRLVDFLDQPHPGDGAIELLAPEKRYRLHSCSGEDGMAVAVWAQTSTGQGIVRTGRRHPHRGGNDRGPIMQVMVGPGKLRVTSNPSFFG